MDTLTNILNEELDALRADIIARQRALGKTATGRTAASIQTRITPDGNGELLLPEWFGSLETGRGPARSKGDGDGFTDSLREWITAKGIPYNNEADLQRLARFLRWRINTFGSAMYRNGQNTPIVEPAVDDFTRRLEQRVTEALAKEITDALAK